MRIRITRDIGHQDDHLTWDISDLVGQEFEVHDTDDDGVYISARGIDNYLIYDDEYDVIEGGKNGG